MDSAVCAAMDSDSTIAIAGCGGGGGDRLSNFCDATLGHILSFLPADEAARTAVLSRRWRHVFAHVHTVSLVEPEPEPDSDDDGYYGCYTPGFGPCRNCDVQDRVATFVNRVSAALLARLRLGVPPLRALRVGFREFSPRSLNAALLDMWVSYAVQQAGDDDLHLDLRLYRDQPFCNRRYSLYREPPPVAAKTTPLAVAVAGKDQNPSPREYVAPRSLFTCAALRTLRLGYCCLDDDPAAVALLPSLDTLHLTVVTGAVQRLVSSCPRVTALTLEACGNLTALYVPAAVRLRTLALRCCHDLATVVVADASGLRAFEYRGAVPAGPSFLTLHNGGGGPLAVSSCRLDFCGEEAVDASRMAGLSDMLRLFGGVKRLHLTSARLGCRAASLSPSSAFPAFAKLRHLELTGMLPDDDATGAIDAVVRILERTPSLETLTLFFMPEPEPEHKQQCGRYGHEDELLHRHKLKYDEHTSLTLPDVELPCLRERVKEINFVHYQGGKAQRMLAKLLLCNAPAVLEVCGEFASAPLFVQIKLMEEIKGWVMNKSANMMFF